jgi:hypothetical protein
MSSPVLELLPDCDPRPAEQLLLYSTVPLHQATHGVRESVIDIIAA